jgi:hypothetical protein
MQPENMLDSGEESREEAQMRPAFIELTELRSTSIDRKLGYCGHDRLVTVGYKERTSVRRHL